MDGSTIRVLLDAEQGGARNQSLAEATLEAGHATERHYHADTEELYVLLAGSGEMEVEGTRREVGPGDAILIPAGAWHQIRAGEESSASSAAAPRPTATRTRSSPELRRRVGRSARNRHGDGTDTRAFRR